MISIGLLTLGLVIAIVGAIILIDGASSLAAHFKIPQVVIGAVVIGFGTSLPELTVNLTASIHGATTMVLIIVGALSLVLLPIFNNNKVELNPKRSEVPA